MILVMNYSRVLVTIVDINVCIKKDLRLTIILYFSSFFLFLKGKLAQRPNMQKTVIVTEEAELIRLLCDTTKVNKEIQFTGHTNNT